LKLDMALLNMNFAIKWCYFIFNESYTTFNMWSVCNCMSPLVIPCGFRCWFGSWK